MKTIDVIKLIIVLLIAPALILFGRWTVNCPETDSQLSNQSELISHISDSLTTVFSTKIESLESEIDKLKIEKSKDSLILKQKLNYYYEKVYYYNHISQDSNFIILSNKYKLEADQ